MNPNARTQILNNLVRAEYNLWGMPAVQRLASRDGYYILISTADCGRTGIETMVFLSSQEGDIIYAGEIICTHGKTYEKSEQRCMEILESLHFSIPLWVERHRSHMTEYEYSKEDLAEFEYAVRQANIKARNLVNNA